jgi:hypothetical protein
MRTPHQAAHILWLRPGVAHLYLGHAALALGLGNASLYPINALTPGMLTRECFATVADYLLGELIVWKKSKSKTKATRPSIESLIGNSLPALTRLKATGFLLLSYETKRSKL